MLQSAYLRLCAFMLLLMIMALMAFVLVGYLKVFVDLAGTIFVVLSSGVGHG